jgi:hypothetical protein
MKEFIPKHIDNIDIQQYLIHYEWDIHYGFYYDESQNIHVELDKKYFQEQKQVLYEQFSKYVTLEFDREDKEVIFLINDVRT